MNDGLRMMILRATTRFPNLEMFPEHRDVEWEDVTVAGINYLTLPADQIAIQKAYVPSPESASPPNHNTAQWRLLAYMSPKDFDQLPKSSQNGYPTNWTQREGKFLVWPTPTASYLTYVKLDGVEDEPDMSSASDTPRTHIRWHPAWLDISTSLMADSLGYDGEAARFLASADQKIQSIGQSMVSLRKADLKKAVRVKGMPGGMSIGGRWW